MKEYVDIRTIINASLALFISASYGVNAMEGSKEKEEGYSGLFRNNYETILKEIEALTTRIHAEVHKVLADYKRDTAEYHRRMGVKRGETETPKKVSAHEAAIRDLEAKMEKFKKERDEAQRDGIKAFGEERDTEVTVYRAKYQAAQKAYQEAEEDLRQIKSAEEDRGMTTPEAQTTTTTTMPEIKTAEKSALETKGSADTGTEETKEEVRGNEEAIKAAETKVEKTKESLEKARVNVRNNIGADINRLTSINKVFQAAQKAYNEAEAELQHLKNKSAGGHGV